MEVKVNKVVKLLSSVDFTQCYIFSHNHTMAHRVSTVLNAKGRFAISTSNDLKEILAGIKIWSS